MVRREGRAEEVDDLCLMAATAAGMVVEWCDQQRMLAHPLVGCFVSPIQALELEDEADEWSPPRSDKCRGTQLSRMEREEQGRGSNDISCAQAD